MSKKERLTVTVDPELVEAANEAVKEGRADSLSAWVSLALSDRARKEQKLRALAEAVAVYERKFGTITVEELAAQQRADRGSARVVRDRVTRGSPKRIRRRRRAA